MKRIPLNDYLSTRSNWPRRLLGWEAFEVDRTEKNVTVEYDEDRYSPLLDLTSTRMEDYKVREFSNLGMEIDGPIFISLGEEIFQTSLRMARHLLYGFIRSTVERFATGTVCELGCGYGYNLGLLGPGAYGGEYSAKAVQLGRRLGMDVTAFNYYRAGDYALIRDGSTIFTHHSLEQLPSAEAFLGNLAAHRSKIREVIHIEPCWLEERSTLLGQIRNRYNQLIDHNHDLVRLLRADPRVEITHFEPDVFGMHPLNASILTVWRFK